MRHRGHRAGNLTAADFPNKLHYTMSNRCIASRPTGAPHPDRRVHRAVSRPVTELAAVVRPEWIDSNGHMNLAYYVVVFDLATDALYAALNIGDAYREATGYSCFTAETHTLYEREVHLGDRLNVRSWLLGADTKRLHYFHEMFHAESGERSAAQELMALHIDMGVRRVAPYPPDRYSALRQAVTDFAPAVPPKGAGRRIALPGR
jgi:acyl-CoA thioester hydrolase